MDDDSSIQLTEEDIEGASLKGRTPNQLTSQELRFWLSCRQIKTTKLKTKAELVSRTQTLLETTNYKDVVDPTKDQTYRKRKVDGEQPQLQVKGNGSDCEIVPPSSGWTKTIPLASLANFSDVHIQEYCLQSGKRAFRTSSSQPRKKTCIRPETRGYQFFTEGYLHDMWTVKQETHIFLKSRCFPSQKKSEEPHKLWCTISPGTQEVLKAQCSCVAGLSGYCNHTLALLYQISHFVKASMSVIPEDQSKTSLPQSWHKPRIEGVCAEPIMQVSPRNPMSERCTGTCTLYEARRPNVLCNDGELLRDVQRALVAENPLFGITYMVSPETHQTVYCPTQLGSYVPEGSLLSYQLALTEGNFRVDCQLQSLNRFRCKDSCVIRGDAYPSLPLDDMPEYVLNETLPPNLRDKLRSLILTKKEMITVERETRDQATSDLWWSEREFRLTASTFAEIVRRKKQNCEKFVQRLRRKQPDNVKTKTPLPIKHGKDHENIAVRKYHRYMENIGHKVKIHNSGLVIRQELPFLGCTPDRKVLDPIAHPHYGIVEVKCPYVCRGITPKEAANIDKQFCLQTSSTGILSLKHTHPYYQQVQGQMGVTGAKWCDFVVYTFKGLFIERVPFDAGFWEQMRDSLEQFYFTHYLPIALKS